ncbi:germination protein M [Butyrivibrio proteoclasticus]|uniref:Germination protein M n=2 Tax=Butyrivibrio proteoclasticus TaxID=43305 RepID=A0A1I5R2Z9_9FIRM|nr:germination protein M [Butyrivibrio proteoclasticus]
MINNMNKRQMLYKRIMFACIGVMISILTVGCERKNHGDADDFMVYYVNSSETGIISESYEIQADMSDLEAVVNELITMLETMPDRLQYEAPIAGDIKLINYSLKDKLLTLNFDRKYNELGRTIEILDRAAIVRTFTQLEDVEYVTFQVEGTPLTDHSGNVIGNMSADTFIYNVGKEISTYEKIELKLYFANETGTKLVPVYRSVVYNSNISMERLAAEQVISGPNTDIAFPTVNRDSKIKSVNIKDGVCYIDFDSTFLTQTQSVSAEVALYSIVNTITEFSDVNKVVLSVNGETSFTFMDFAISGPYERNLDIVE